MRVAVLLCAVFLASGIWLEAMYGLRAEGWIEDDIRREFLRLGHAHGALLGLLNIGIAVAMERLRTPETWAKKIRLAGLVGAGLVGLGFFTAGLWHGPTDPGPTVLLVPAGALMLVASLAAIVMLRPVDEPSA
jgi:peptidoglycan/LPS O-acetylase OafA/YrhL